MGMAFIKEYPGLVMNSLDWWIGVPYFWGRDTSMAGRS
jgi:hypothetical protein